MVELEVVSVVVVVLAVVAVEEAGVSESVVVAITIS